MNKSVGNMYSWCNATWNPVKGRCPHGCQFCYMRRFPLKPPRLVESELNDLGSGSVVFVGSSIDLFAEAIPKNWVERVLEHANKYPKNTYLFQSRNPERFNEFAGLYPPERIFGTTIQSDLLWEQDSKVAPEPWKRAFWMTSLKNERKMVSIEPVMKFNLEKLVDLIQSIEPEFVSVGADSKGNNLPEPSKQEVEALLSELKKFTRVSDKHNLKRILGY